MVQENYSTPGGDILLKYESGVLTVVGNIGFGDIRGLAYDASTDTLFGVSRTSSRLITIDRATGVGTEVSGNDFLPPGSNTSEITVDSFGEMFGGGHAFDMTAVDTLLAVDKSTGIASEIGDIGISFLSGFAFDRFDDTLYGTEYDGTLYTIDTSTGASALVGKITGGNGNVARIAFDQPSGICYGVTTSNQLVSVDMATLTATEVAQFSGDQIYSLDFVQQPDLTQVNLLGPADQITPDSAPLFTWDADGGANNRFVVDLIAPGIYPMWTSTYLAKAKWQMPVGLWNSIPPDSQVYWRVRGTDLDATVPVIIISDEVWSFIKP